jgi:hypothetical protein
MMQLGWDAGNSLAGTRGTDKAQVTPVRNNSRGYREENPGNIEDYSHITVITGELVPPDGVQ